MHLLPRLTAALFGLIWGSFCNVLICRIPQSESILGRSRCPQCKQTLKVVDLVPVLSYLIFKGRCRYCGNHISPLYPVVELLTAGIFVLLYHLFFTEPTLLVLNGFFLTCALLVAFIDFRHMIIPNVVVVPATAVSAASLLLQINPQGLEIAHGLLGAISGGGLFLAMWIFTRGAGMGMGDVKWAFFMGLTLGPIQLIPALLIASFSGLLLAAVSLTVKKLRSAPGIQSDISCQKDGRRFLGVKFIGGKPAVPFGTFLALGFSVMLLYGDTLLNWWLRIY